MDDVFACQSWRFSQNPGQAFVGEVVESFVSSFRHAIGVKEECIAGRQLNKSAAIWSFVQQAQGKTSNQTDWLHSSGSAQQIGRIVAGIAIVQMSRACIEEAVETGSEHGRDLLAHEHTIDFAEAAFGQHTLKRRGLDLRARNRHIKGCRNPFTGDISYDHCEMIVVQQEEVEEVAAYGLG